MDQLCAIDSMFLGLEDENTQANIGGVSILEGPPPRFAELKRQAEGALTMLPRYRQKLYKAPLGIGRHLWVDDEDFDISNHLISVNLGRSVTLDRVNEYFADVMATHLDRSSPLWKIHIVRGLPNRQWAILWTVHHAMVDGIAATDLLTLLLNFDPDAQPLPLKQWSPRPAPQGAKAIASALTGASGPLKPVRDLRRALGKPAEAVRLATTTARSLVPVGRSLLEPNDCPLNGSIGPGRDFHVTRLDLAAVKAARVRHGGSVNDIVLAAITDGLREFLITRHKRLCQHNTRTMVPVSTRTEEQYGKDANHVSAVFVDLPVDIEDPVERLESIRSQMDRIKQTEGSIAAKVLGEVANYVPHEIFELGERAVWRFADTQRFFNTITTNVPGPQFPLYCLGREMTEVYPYIMLMKDTRISTAVFSYNGSIFFGITSDRDSIPDADNVIAGVDAALAHLAGEQQPPVLAQVAG